jgi:nucleoid DNA-binding protein
MSKANIINELCKTTGILKKDVAQLLNALTNLACREAVNGFTIPGLCRFKIIRRKATRRWNPGFKKYVLMKEHDVLKVTPIQKARKIITPKPADLIQILPDAPAPAKPAAAQSDHKSAPAAQHQPQPAAHVPQLQKEDLGNILFLCSQCNNTVMAEAGQGGMIGECPVCNAKIKIPAYDRKNPTPAHHLKPKLAAGADGKGMVDRSSMTIRMDVADFVSQT